MDRLLQPPLHIKTYSSQPLSLADAQQHLAAFLDQFQARARDSQAGSGESAGASGGGGGAIEGSLLARLVDGLEHEVKAKAGSA